MSEFLHRYGPVALVTGASSGIGVAFAELLAEKGFNLVLVARRRDRMDALAARLKEAHGTEALVLTMDLSAADAAEQILGSTIGQDIGLVVSNAGFGLKGEHSANDPKAMADMLMVNCNTPMQLAHGLIPRLKQRGRGGIIFTASVEALMGCPYSTAYSASKALVKSLGEGLWAELEPHGIEVLTLCPGPTESEAAANQGIDPSTLKGQMPAAEVARLTLENIDNGPTFISSDIYKAMFERMTAMPRRDALRTMAQAMKR